jgi:hypothetical protein
LSDSQAELVPPILSTAWPNLTIANFDLSQVGRIFDGELLVVLGETTHRVDTNHGSAATSDAIAAIEICAQISPNANIVAAIDEWEDASDLASQRDILLIGSGICNTYAFALNDLVTPVRFDKHEGRVHGQIVALDGSTKVRFGSRANAGRHCALIVTMVNPFAPNKRLVWVAGITGRATQAAMTLMADIVRRGRDALTNSGLPPQFKPVACVVRARGANGLEEPPRGRVARYEMLWAADASGDVVDLNNRSSSGVS